VDLGGSVPGDKDRVGGVGEDGDGGVGGGVADPGRSVSSVWIEREHRTNRQERRKLSARRIKVWEDKRRRAMGRTSLNGSASNSKRSSVEDLALLVVLGKLRDVAVANHGVPARLVDLDVALGGGGGSIPGEILAGEVSGHGVQVNVEDDTTCIKLGSRMKVK
jgi:hypothetical protein